MGKPVHLACSWEAAKATHRRAWSDFPGSFFSSTMAASGGCTLSFRVWLLSVLATYTVPSRLVLFFRRVFDIVEPPCCPSVSLPSHVVVLLLQDMLRVSACPGLGAVFNVIPRLTSLNPGGVTRHAAASHLMRAQFHVSHLLQGQSCDVNPSASRTMTVVQ